ncbi:MAG: hypothetical protein J7L23_03925 [Candidatus Diapherotrites archaeon]|nr:hypothetical protein [Candidatus Diapherotrites archaeon]
MQYKHLKLLHEMIDKNISQSKIMHYFQLEGYSEEEVLKEINDYEEEKTLKSEDEEQ